MSDFEAVMLTVLFELASRPRPLLEVDRRSLDAAETWLRKNSDGQHGSVLEWEAVVVL